jgi:hypothetical protein
MNKRGLSEVITTVLIILLVLGAIVIIWTVVKPMIQKSSEQISSDLFTISLSLKKDTVINNPILSQVKFTLQRGAGPANLKGINVVIKDNNGNTKTVRKDFPEGFNELDSRAITINYKGTNLTSPKEVSIAPIILNKDNKELPGNIISSEKIQNPDLFKGIVAYWKFDESSYLGIGNEVKDQTGNHDGQAKFNLTTAPGKLENAAKFDGNISQVLVSNPTAINFTNDITILAWVNHTDRFPYLLIQHSYSQALTILAKTTSPGWDGKIFSLGPGNSGGYSPFPAEYNFNSTLGYGGIPDLSVPAPGTGILAKQEILPDRWYQVAVTFDKVSKDTILYINGQKSEGYHTNNTTPSAFDYQNGIGKFWPIPDRDTQSIKIGAIYDNPNLYHYNFDGLIDEVMIFNRTLTGNEINQIYSFYPN